MTTTVLPDVLRLENDARDYAWGSPTVLPALLGEEPTGAPVAEIWIGAHPGQPSHWTPGQPSEPGGPGGSVGPARVGLDALVAADPVGLLGPAAAGRFGGRLPFLLKLLAADRVLSLQVHPDLDQAREGFARENAAGIPVGAPHRNYQDDNHKPELLCAVTPFEALCGFREPAATAQLLRALGGDRLTELADRVEQAPDLREPLRFLLGLDRDEAQRWVADAAAAAARCGDPRWAAVADCTVRLAEQSPDEIGPVVAMLLNLVHLEPGQAVFLAAGQVHAYVRGFGVEILANSDNVLRCGLTPKHVDVDELLRIATFTPAPAEPWPSRPGGPGARVFPVPVDDFELVRYELDGAAHDLTAPGPQVVVVTAGQAALHGDGTGVDLAPGAAAFVPAGRTVRLTGDGVAFRATVGPRVTS